MLIGTIQSIELEENGISLWATVKPSADIGGATAVFVVVDYPGKNGEKLRHSRPSRRNPVYPLSGTVSDRLTIQYRERRSRNDTAWQKVAEMDAVDHTALFPWRNTVVSGFPGTVWDAAIITVGGGNLRGFAGNKDGGSLRICNSGRTDLDVLEGRLLGFYGLLMLLVCAGAGWLTENYLRVSLPNAAWMSGIGSICCGAGFC